MKGRDMDELSRSLGDIVSKEVTSGTTKPMPAVTPLRQTTTARARVDSAIAELEMTIADLNTLVATLRKIKEQL